MAAAKPPVKERMRYIDPIYKKFTARAFQTMTSAEFYDYFMATMSRGEHQFQFSNRKIDKRVDEKWVEEIEIAIPALEAISRDPRIIITQEELITNVALAKKVTGEVVKHLISHSNLVERITDDGEVIPAKLLNLYKEESWETYENRFVYTLLEKTFQFVDLRYQRLFEQMDDEFGAHLKIDSNAATNLERIELHMDLRINQQEDLLSTDGKHENIFSRIARIHRILQTLMRSKFAIELSKYSRIKPPLVPTNAIKKNPHLRKCTRLWNFLIAYYDIGYSIEIVEQNPEINPKFEQDIFNDIMFNYIILKGYLEDSRDRAIDYKMRAKKKQLKPKYIKEIIEEIVKDYDLPDIEVRKVLIEELTKAQLMQEEEEERLRLVEEKEREMKEKKRLEDLEKARIQKEKEKEERRIAREKERERVRKQKEIEAEKQRIEKEKERKLAYEARLGQLYAKELEEQTKQIEIVLAAKQKQRELEEKLRLAAEEKARKQREAAEREAQKAEKKRLAEEARLRKEAELEAARLRREAEALAKLEEEKLRLEAEKKAEQAAKELAKKMEVERKKAEAEARKVAQEAARLEAERLALEEAARLEQARIEEEQHAHELATKKIEEEKLRLAREAIEQQENLKKSEQEAKLAKARLTKQVDRIVEERVLEELKKAGLGRSKNSRDKKLEHKLRMQIRDEEYIKAGLKNPKAVVEIKPIEVVPEAEAPEETVLEAPAPEAPAPEAPAPEAATRKNVRDSLSERWKKWRK